MKKALSVIIVCVMLAGMVLPTAAAGCNHSYAAEDFAADCRNKARTVYTCSLCGDSYTVYADEYTEPDGMYILATSERSGSRITVECYYYNNPGLSCAQMILIYNNSALKIESVQNSGKIWSDDEYVSGLTWDDSKDHITLYAEAAGDESNTANGLCFTVVFEVTDDSADTGIYFKKNLKSFLDWDNENLKVIDRDPVVIDLIGKSDLGAHAYTRGKCANCGATDPDAHTVSIDGKESLYSPGDTVALSGMFYTEGTRAFRFIRWHGDTDVLEDATDGTGEFTMPKRDLTLESEYIVVGDASGDGEVNAIDLNLMRRHLVGLYKANTSVIDINADDNVNAIDLNLMRRMLVGLYKPEK